MKYPSLVPAWACNVQISVYLTDGITERGTPDEVILEDKKCNYSEKMKQVLDTERRLVTLSATALFNGDIAPNLKTLEGYASVNGGPQLLIFRAERPRNPDGTVNYTRLELM